jgi:hypothetical protein
VSVQGCFGYIVNYICMGTITTAVFDEGVGVGGEEEDGGGGAGGEEPHEGGKWISRLLRSS